MSDLPKNTRLLRNAWFDSGHPSDSGMLHENGRSKALFINHVHFPDWGRAYFASIEIAKLAADTLTKSGAFAIGETPHFSPEPDYMIDDDGPIPTIWVNAYVPQQGEVRWNAVIAEAKADVEILEEFKNAKTTEAMRAVAVKDRLRKRGQIPSFPTGALKMTEGEGHIARLLSRLNIR